MILNQLFKPISKADYIAGLREHARASGVYDPDRNPLLDQRLTDAVRYSSSGRKAKDCGSAAYTDQLFRDHGWETRMENGVWVSPLAWVSRYMRTAQSYQTTVATAGQELVATNLRSEQFIDVLRTRTVVGHLGADNVGGLVGDVQFPRETATANSYWVTTQGTSPVTSGPITESEALFDATPVVTAPSQIGAMSKMSRLFFLQGGDLADYVLRNDLTNGLATAIDVAAIQGTGVAGQPTGVTNLSGVGAASGASISYAGTVGAVTTVASANGIVNRSTLGWVTTPGVAGLLAQRPKIAGYPDYLWSGAPDTGTINGHLALATNNAPANVAIFGDWSQVMLLSWGSSGPIEIAVDPYGGGFSAGDMRIRAMLSCGIVIRHPQSFVVLSNIT